MKKILLVIALALCIFQMIVLATAVDIGSPAIEGAGNYSNAATRINRENPANVTGVITSVAIYAGAEMSDCQVATFYIEAGTNLSTRDWELIGAVPAGYSIHSVNINVTVGDCIGICFPAEGSIAYNAGTEACWYRLGDNIPCDDVEFTATGNWKISVLGIGISYLWNTKTLIEWNGAVPNIWNEI